MWIDIPPKKIHRETIRTWETANIITTIKKTQISPGWCSSVDWAPACEPGGRWFDSQSVLRARSPVGGMWEATTHQDVSLPPPSLPLSLKLNKILKKRKCKSKLLHTHWNTCTFFKKGKWEKCVRVWRNWNPHALLVEMRNGADAVGNSLAAPQRTGHGLTIWPRHPLPGTYLRELKTCSQMFPSALLMMVTKWKQPK